jgi:hypothetical protein
MKYKPLNDFYFTTKVNWTFYENYVYFDDMSQSIIQFWSAL